MRTVLCLAVLGLSGSVAWADQTATVDVARAEMAAALVEQADLHPAPLTLPTMAAAPRHAAASSAVKRGTAPRRPHETAGKAANQVSARDQTRAAWAAQQAQAAAAAAAGQAQSRAAKERASRPRPR